MFSHVFREANSLAHNLAERCLKNGSESYHIFDEGLTVVRMFEEQVTVRRWVMEMD